MKILALDTSSIVATVAILDGEKLMAEYTLNHKKNHSEKLMPILQEILNSCDLSPKDIDIFRKEIYESIQEENIKAAKVEFDIAEMKNIIKKKQ